MHLFRFLIILLEMVNDAFLLYKIVFHLGRLDGGWVAIKNE